MKDWERRSEVPLAVLALGFLLAWSAPIIDPGLDRGWRAVCTGVIGVSWALFAVDYLVRLVTAERRRRWFAHHLVDLAALVLPVLRPLRVVRVISVLRILNRTSASSLRGRVGLYVAGGSALLAFVAAVAVLDAERGRPDASIQTLSSALWWACATMSTVGYGDLYPVTAQGRFIGVGLMIGGIALLGTVTATFASWLLQAVAAETDSARAVERAHAVQAAQIQVEAQAEVDELGDQVSALRREIAALTVQLQARGGA